MEYPKQNEDEHSGEVFFTAEFSSSSEDETEIEFSQKDLIGKMSPQYGRYPSPPLILAFPLPGRDITASGSNLQEEQVEDSDQPIEEWMILGGEEQQGDSSIQLNLGYWSSSSSEDDSGNKGTELNSPTARRRKCVS